MIDFDSCSIIYNIIIGVPSFPIDIKDSCFKIFIHKVVKRKYFINYFTNLQILIYRAI